MSTWSQLLALLRQNVADWRSLRPAELQYLHSPEARTALLGLLGLTLVLLLLRSMLRRSGRHGLVLPALLKSFPRSRPSVLVHAPAVLFVLGVPFFGLALADPFTALLSREVSFPGRRIGIMIDASISMRTPFTAATLNERQPTDAVFFTTVAAAQRFVRLRMEGKYRDLIGIIEFGNEAYVIMPFTSDYENVLLSMSLIGDPNEYGRFPTQGTVIARAIDETVGLYKAFNFEDAAGNLMIIFSDGEDSTYQIGKKTLEEIIQSAIDAKIPVHLVRMNYKKDEGMIIPDERWASAVHATGGQFYAASDEDSLLRAIHEIDRAATGTIEFRQYTSQEPRFAPFALVASALWAAAAGLKLGAPYFLRLS